MIKERRAINRLNFLFNAITRGLTAQQAYDELEHYKEFGRQESERGQLSVKNVISALKPLPYVSGISIASVNSRNDRRGKDLTVYFNGHDPKITLDCVYVQVKSSSTVIRSFRQELAERWQIPYDYLTERLLEKRLALLNGQLPEDEIRQNFVTQVQEINEFRRSHRRKG